MLLMPQTLLLIMVILLVITFVSIYVTKKAVKLSKEEINHDKGSLVSLAFRSWGINIASLAAALVIMDMVSLSIPFFEVLHSEWRGITEHAPIPEIVYIFCLALSHGALLVLSYPAFKKRILSRAKRIKIFVVFDVMSALMWALLMCFGLGVL